MAIRIAADLGQHHLAEAGLHHQVDAGDRIGAQHQLVQLGGHPFGGDAAQLAAPSRAIASRTRGATAKPSCETNRAARSIRSGSSPNDTSGADGRVEHPVAQRGQSA